MGRKRAKKRRPTKRGRGKTRTKTLKALPSDVRTTTVKAELAKAVRKQPSHKANVAASLLTAPAPEATAQLLATQALGNHIAAENRTRLPQGPIAVIEKNINSNLVEDWKVALPPNHPSRLFSGSVLLNPQTSLRSGTY